MGEKPAALLEGPLSAAPTVLGETGLGRDLAVARRVIRAEIDGLEQLARALDGAFGAALDLCAAARGRLIVTGIGKSGHVARKIAATLASTGTPAQFVHAGRSQPRRSRHDRRRRCDPRAVEFRRDSAELADIIAYSRRFEIPLIGDHRRPRLDARRGGRRRAAAAARRRGVPDGAGADHLDDDDDGARRRAGDRAARAQGLLARRLPACSTRAARLGRRLLRVGDIMHAGDGGAAGRAGRADVRGDPR